MQIPTRKVHFFVNLTYITSTLMCTQSLRKNFKIRERPKRAPDVLWKEEGGPDKEIINDTGTEHGDTNPQRSNLA